MTLGQGLSLSGSQFSVREDQNLGSEFSRCPACPVGMYPSLAGLPLMLYPSPSCCFQLWGPRSEPGETSHRPRAQQGARAKHQRDDHRGPLAHQVMKGVWGWDGDLGALISPLRDRQGLRLLLGSRRLSRTCLHYLGEFGEDQIYEAHQQGRGALETLLCGGPQGACSEEGTVTRTEL